MSFALASRLAAERNDPLSAGYRLPDIDQRIAAATAGGFAALLFDVLKEQKR